MRLVLIFVILFLDCTMFAVPDCTILKDNVLGYAKTRFTFLGTDPIEMVIKLLFVFI